ncbi:hypothetical protein [Fusobacterium varium]|uniref:hypothetical protein n=1 Tax=Fusobacterium varium TaxID=856 RepID=UPI001F33F65F|nr:hypothetical protein [Fusobacterium varium]MCF2673374.1 hypothetical protein [Fusobacterium varium]
MKKIILGLFFIISSLSFSEWLNLGLVDEFEEKTGEICAYYQIGYEGCLRVDFKKDGTRSLYIKPDNYVSSDYKKETLVKFKIDDNRVLTLIGYVRGGGKIIQCYEEGENVYIFDDVIEQMKAGRHLKLLTEKYDENVLNKINLSGFTNSYNNAYKRTVNN